MSIRDKVVNGVLWNAFERFSTQGIQLVLTIFIARLLSPSDYGLIAMLSIFMAVAQAFVDSGFTNALIQNKGRTEKDYATMFFFNIFAASLVYFLLFCMAPWVARFYSQPELTSILRVYSIVLIINSFASVHMTRLTIELNFRKQALVSIWAVVISGFIGLWMAYHGFGVWTLVYQALIFSLVWTLMLSLQTKWIPKSFFSYASFRSLFTYGSKLLVSGMLHTICTHMYSLTIGKFFMPDILGYFNRAFALGQFPVQNLGNIMHWVTFPILCNYQNDEEKFNSLITSYLRVSAFLLYPLMVGMAVLAVPLISVVLTDKWLPTAPLLQILCFAMMWHPAMQINVSILDAKGRSDYHLKSEIIKKLMAVLILCVTLPMGIPLVCMGIVVYNLFDFIIVVAFSSRLTSITFLNQLKMLMPIWGLSLAMGVVVLMSSICFTLPVAKLLSGIVVGIFFYGFLAYWLKFQELELLISLVRRKEEKKAS